MTVVLGLAGILLHEAIGHGLEGDFNRKGSSAFSAVSASVAPRASRCWTTARLPTAGSLNVDDEGNASQRNVLIEDGILVHPGLAQRASSGVKPTGNGAAKATPTRPCRA
jgi:TldD protein